MRGYLKLLLLTGTLCNITPTWAVGVGGACDATNKCNAGLYCESTTHKCSSCSATTSGAYPESIEGTIGIGNCYVTCSTQTVTLGVKKTNPEKKQVKQSTGKTCNDFYQLSCVENAEPNADNTACQCQSTYQQSGTTCTSKCFTITLKKNLTNVFEQDKFLYVKFGTGFYKNSSCSDPALTTGDEWVTPTFKWFQDFSGYSTEETGGTTRFGSDGKPTNGTTNTTFTDNTTLYGQWNKNDYTVEYYDGDTRLDSQTCHVADYDAENPSSDGNCPAKSIERSNARGETITGWSLTKGGTTKNYTFGANIPPNATEPTIKLYAVWEPCPAGYYCNASGKTSCPAGSTSGSGSNAQTQCYISAATQFSDGGIVFTLPLDPTTKIYYK